jgi:hypothetical protein
VTATESAAFGPRGEAVAAVIDRAGRVTPEEVEALAAAWLVDWNTSQWAAWSDTWYAAWNAACGAARDDAWWAAEAVTRGAARDAACAELVRDLITPEQYDTLAGPWNSVIGETKVTAPTPCSECLGDAGGNR